MTAKQAELDKVTQDSARKIQALEKVMNRENALRFHAADFILSVCGLARRTPPPWLKHVLNRSENGTTSRPYVYDPWYPFLFSDDSTPQALRKYIYREEERSADLSAVSR